MSALARLLLLALLCSATLPTFASDEVDDEEDPDPSPNGGQLCDTIANCSSVGTDACNAGKCVCMEDYTCADCSEECINGVWAAEDCRNACTGEPANPIPQKKKRSDGEIAGIVIALLLAFASLMLFLQYMLSPMSMSKEAKAEARAEAAKAQIRAPPPPPPTQPSTVSADMQQPPATPYTMTNSSMVYPPPTSYTGYSDDTATVMSGATGYSNQYPVPYSDSQSMYSTSVASQSVTPSVYTPSAYTPSVYTGTASTVSYAPSHNHHNSRQPL